MHAALEHRLSKHLRYFRVCGTFRVQLAILAIMLTPLQLPFIVIPPMTEQARDAEERKDNAKRGFGQQNVAKERLGVPDLSIN